MAFRGILRLFISADTKEVEEALTKVNRQVTNLVKSIEGAGGNFSGAFTTPLKKWGDAAMAAAREVKDAMNYVALGTGAQGEALRGLQNDFKAIAGLVPDSIGASAQAIADLNTMLGTSGKELQDMSVRILNLSRITGTDLGRNIATVSKLMNNWGISTARYNDVLDKLLVANQNTGVSMDAIANGITKAGSSLRTMGIDLEQSMALFGLLDKAGLDAATVLKSLQRVMMNFAAAGVKDFSTAFKSVYDSIKSAKDLNEAVALSTDIFGRLQGANMAMAIREGRMEVEDLTQAIRESAGAVDYFTDEAENFDTEWARICNKLTMALEPLGTQILRIAKEWLPLLGDSAEVVNIQFSDTTVKIGMFLAALGPVTVALAGAIKAFQIWAGAIVKLLVLSTGPAGLIAIIGATVIGLGNYTQSLYDAKNAAEQAKRANELLGGSLEEISTENLEAKLVGLQTQLTETRKRAEETMQALWKLDSARAAQRGGIFGGNALHEISSAYQENNNEEKALEKAIEQIQDEKQRREVNKVPATTVTQKFTAGDKVFKLSASKSSGSGKSAIELFIENARDRMKYFHEDGQQFLADIGKMQAKIKPLSKDWKSLEDLKIDINDEAFNNAINKINDVLKKPDVDGTQFLPQLDELEKKYGALNEKNKKAIEDLRNSIADTTYTEKWSKYSWEFSQGLLHAVDYAKLLKVELDTLTPNTDKWRDKYAELQSVYSTLLSEQVSDLRQQYDSLEISASAYEDRLKQLQSIFPDFANAVKITSDALKVLHKELDNIAKANEIHLRNSLKSATEEFRTLKARGIEEAMNATVQAIVYNGDLGESLKKLGQEIIAECLRFILLQNILRAFGFASGGGSVGMPSNMGAWMNAYRSSNPLPFASGGVVNRPTLFPMASGGVGLMGEAGAEAIMPLERAANGRLGVRAIGAGVRNEAPTVVVNVENQSGTQLQATQGYTTFDEQFNRAVVQVLLKDQQTNGPITRNYRRR